MTFNMNNISYSDFKNICRLCMLSCDIKFPRDNVISDVFYKLTDIQFETNDELPQQICLKCFKKINETHEFALQCKATHSSLLKCLNYFKNSRIKEELYVSEEIYESFNTEEEITIDKHEIEFLKEEVLNSTSEYNIDEIKLKEDIEEDKNNELEGNMVPETSVDQHINCSENDLLKLKTLNIEVENKEEFNDKVNLKDSNEVPSVISVNPNKDSTDNNKDIFKGTNDKHFKCDVCNGTFISFRLFKKHKSKLSCERRKKSELSLKSPNLKSQQSTHSGERPYRCEPCSKSFSFLSNLKIHMRAHNGESPYKCKECEKSFRRSSSLKEHIRTHSGERFYKCKQCSKSYSYSSHLKSHMRMHTGERPYKCEQCSKSFLYSTNLKDHIRTHSGKRPYTCNECLKSFARNSTLKDHVRMHSGDRPFKCKQCSKSFLTSSKFKRHMHTHNC